MDVQPQPIDARLLPGMMELNVKEALDKASSLCAETRESADYCQRLLERLLFLRDELRKAGSQPERLKLSAQFANTIRLVIVFLKKVSEKKLLQRIAASRLIRKEVERLHKATDEVFRAAGLSNSSLMTEWREKKEGDIAKLRSNLDDLARNRSNLVSGLTESDLEEALTEIKFEIELGENVNDFGDLLESVFDAVADQGEVTVLQEIPEWFIRRNDVVLVGKFDQGSFGVAHKGKWGTQEVCIKQLLVDGPQARMLFLEAADGWRKLSHPHVVKFHGGCHVGKPYFFVSEYAENSNFTNYFRCADNKSKVWRLFLQAAQGLAYLHGQGIVHSEIKCANLLVSGDGSAKLSDFGFSHLRTLSVGISVKELPSSTRWKAPECLLEQGDGAKPSFKSDVYALAMSIVEAKIGGLPWGEEMDEDSIIGQLATEEGYPRPEGIFTDKEWSLAQAMTAFDRENRITVQATVELLQELAEEHETTELAEGESKRIDVHENGTQQPATQCPQCPTNNPAENKFCGECGAHL